MRLFLLFVVTFAALANDAVGADPIRVMTFNVRYGTAPDGENRWERRRESLMRVISEFDPDVLGVQEALRDQIDAISEAQPGLACVGVGREADGGGEYSAIFYRRKRFDLVAAETFWLSSTPQAPGSRSWGNNLPRICTWARLLDRTDSRRFTVFNTHWDHESQEARVASGLLMGARVAERTAAGEPVLVTGDFNAAEDNPAILGLTKRGELLRDSYRDVHPDGVVGTFHAFTGQGVGKIDAILATADWQTVEANVVRTEADGRYPSDHFPVSAIVELKAAGGEAAERPPVDGPAR